MKVFQSNRDAIKMARHIADYERVVICGRIFEKLPSGGFQCVSGSGGGMSMARNDGRSFAWAKQGKHRFASTKE